MSSSLSYVYESVVSSLEEFTQGIVLDARLAMMTFLVVIAPLVWNGLARLQYRTRAISTLCCGSRRAGCVLLALYIFGFSSFRDLVFVEYLEAWPRSEFLADPFFRVSSIVLFALGCMFVYGSIAALGIYGTFLGDYFGILQLERVSGFPFNILDNPMYVGSTLAFLGHSLWERSPNGVLVTVILYISYRIALWFEEPYTAQIYAKYADKLQKAKKSLGLYIVEDETEKQE